VLALPQLAQLPGMALQELGRAGGDLLTDVLNRTGIDPSAMPGSPVGGEVSSLPVATIPGTSISPLDIISPEVRKGIEKGAGRLYNELRTPESLSTLPLLPLKPVQGLYGLSAATQLPGQIQGLLSSKTVGEAAEQVPGIGLNVAMASLLKPAIRGTPAGDLVGEQGQTHGEVLEDNGVPAESIPHDDTRRGFDLNGEFLNRKEAEEVSGTKGTAKAGGLDSQDLTAAKEATETPKTAPESEVTTQGAGEPEPRHAGIPIPGLDKVSAALLETLNKARRTLQSLAQTKGIREVLTYTRDAADNAARLYAEGRTNDIRGQLRRIMGRGKKVNPLDEEALSFVREADGDRGQLAVMRQKIQNSQIADPKWSAKALKAIDHADANWDNLNQIASHYENITNQQVQDENSAGIDTPSRKGYVMHSQDLPDTFGFLESGTGGDFTGFKHIRTHPTFADSIAAGINPKTINAVDLLQSRIGRGQQLINNRQWLNSLRTHVDPKTNLPIATDPIIQQRGPNLPPDYRAPDGYVNEMTAAGPVSVLKGYSGIFEALTKPSSFSRNLGFNALLKTAAAGKAVSLALDTFHLGRVAFWESIIKPLSFTDPKLPFPSYKKGVLSLDYSNAELQRMAQAGEIPANQLQDILDAKRRVQLGVKEGFNIGRISDAIHQEWLHDVPVFGTFNKWLFNQFQRGAVAEVYNLEFQRYQRMFPNLTEDQVARQLSKDLNNRFGQLGRQGIFKSKSGQDLARLLILAPQWNEGLVRSELGAITGGAKGIRDSVKQGNLAFGVLPRAVGGMILAQFAANQIINYITRGKPTWENPEEGLGSKLSAWVPDVVGGGPGFFLHPLGLAAEITHLLSTKYAKTEDFRRALLEFAGGRYSTLMRPVMTFITGRTPIGARPIRPEDIYFETLKQALPAPIGASALWAALQQRETGEKSERFAGQIQKQIMASGGLKTDQAPSDEQRIGALARKFNESKGIKPSGEFYSGDYDELTSALRRGAKKQGLELYKQLLKKKSAEQIIRHYDLWATHPFTRSLAGEDEFLNTLNPEQKATYEKALAERQRISQQFLQMADDYERTK
jgi:hypothetical protein